MTIDEVIAKYKEIISTDANCPIHCMRPCDKCVHESRWIAEWLEELKALRVYKERMEMQYIDDIDNPLEPLKLQSALQSELFKYNYRKAHKPQDINVLDYTIMYALKHCLEEQLKAGKENIEKKYNNGWIPCSERLPENDTYILLSFENFSVPCIGRYEVDEDNGGAFYPGDEDKSYSSYGLFVNAWMPLPEPLQNE